MSSTARGGVRSVSDYYRTPNHIVRDLINWLICNTDILDGGKIILDPCSGGDKDHTMTYVEELREIGYDPFSIDIREDSLADIKTDFLEFKPDKEYDIVISNPPFALAMEFIEKGLELVKEGAYVIYLLRLNFFGSKKRKPFWDKQMPEYTIVHHERISFFEGGGSDSIEYSHYVFRKGYHPEYSKLIVI